MFSPLPSALVALATTGALLSPLLLTGSQAAEDYPSWIGLETQSHEHLEAQILDLQRQWKENEEEGETERSLHIHANRIRGILCKEGKKEHCPPEEGPVAKNVDLDKLAVAVAVAETSNCTAGTGLSKNNCHGIFACTKGKCGPRTFATTDESFAEFKRMWLRAYGDRFPTIADARKYTAGEGTRWLETVKIVYNRQ